MYRFLLFLPFMFSCWVQAAAPYLSVPNMAHRGFSAAAPENTLTAFQLAVRAGADGAECDVHKTKDGVLVISHDANAKRTTGVDKKFTDMTYAEVRQLVVKQPASDPLNAEKIPTLAEYLAVLKNTATRPVIEIKQGGIAADVVAEVQKAGMQDTAVIISFNENEIKAVRKLAPNISAALLGFDKKLKPADWIAKAKELDIHILDIHHEQLSEEIVRQLHEAGITVWVYTLYNEPQKMHQLLDWGVDGITTDNPDVLAKVLRDRAGKNVP